MDEVQNFDFEGNEVRTLTVNGEPYFVGKDVTDVLGYSNNRDALSKHVDNEDKLTSQIATAGQMRSQTVITESGVYSLIFGSKLESAKRFKRWVTHEVLPTIRKHGAYLTDDKIEEVLSDPDTIIKLATQLKDERTGRLIAEQRVNELQPKADYYDHILQNKGLVPITSIAKNYGWSATRMNRELHDLGVQFNQSGSWYLYSKYQDHGYTHTEPFHYIGKDGNEQVTPKTKWTQKGHIFIYQLLKKHGVLPMIERNEIA